MHIPYKSLLKEKNFTYLLMGRLLKRSALILFSMEIIWLTMELTNNSPFYVSMMVIAETLPFLILGIYGGIKADVWNKKTIMVICDAATAILLITIPFLYSLGYINYVTLMVLAVGISICNCFAEPSFRAILPEILSKEKLQEGNALLDSIQRGASILVPASIGVVLKLTTQIHLFSLAFLFVLGAGIFHLLITYTPKKTDVDVPLQKEGTMTDLKLTIKYLRENKDISFIVIVQGLSILINTGLWRVGLPIYLETYLESGISTFGYITGILGAAAFISSILLGSFKRINPILIFNFGIIIWGIGLVSISIVPSIPVIYTATILIGIGQACEGLSRIIIIQDQVPKHMLGKVFSISSSINYASDTLSLGFISAILALVSIATVFSGGGLLIIVTGVIGAVSLKERYNKMKNEQLNEERLS
ncbi:MFS transporter [Paenibacillus sp. 481]|uniref:MFS transporter n=1 Tax=Paenibacillus sp. 481 TaxID=2835869 RepID=UPI001E3986A6|nr:MFS transporter [Paenibacillus sp. 481]UHA72007.1 MFS transporter [Paenibacillus sp. 481]